MKVIYDGECPVCISLKDFAEKRTAQEPLEFIPFQSDIFPDQAEGLTRNLASQALYTLTDNGHQARGARAVFQVMICLPGFWGAAGRILSLPPLAWIAQPAYALFARHRHKISKWL